MYAYSSVHDTAVYIIKVVIVQCADTESVSVHCVLLVSVCVIGEFVYSFIPLMK